MSTEARLITAEDLWNMPGDQRRELVRGELRVMAPSGFEHGAVIIKLSRLLANHVEDHKLGVVLGAETGYVLARHPDVVRGADVSFVRTDRLPPPDRTAKFFDGPPDLAVEVVSPGDSLNEVEEKTDDYLNAGARLVWVVNPRHRTITVHRAGRDPQVLRESDILSGETSCPASNAKSARRSFDWHRTLGTITSR
jgi:Uma2 family endonuclease